MDGELRTRVAGVFRTWRPDIDSVYDMADDILALVAEELMKVPELCVRRCRSKVHRLGEGEEK